MDDTMKKILLIIFLISFASVDIVSQIEPRFVCDEKNPSTESEYEEWFRGVSLISTYHEQETFEGLSDKAGRAAFVDNFWLRRDPNPDTTVNEFRDEYCARIREARSFAAEKSGWLTDRGMTLVYLGMPDEVVKGTGEYDGFKNVSYETWRFNYIQNVGSISFTFIDTNGSQNYRFRSVDGDTFEKLVEFGRKGLTVNFGKPVN